MKLKFCCVIILTVILSACNSIRETGVSEDGTVRQVSIPIIGEMEIPAKPERVVLMRAMDAGNASLLNADVVGVNASIENSEYIDDDSNVSYLEYGDVDSLRALDPDLIVTFSADEYIEEYQDIAPVIPLNYQSDTLNKFRERIYLNQLLFLGVVLNQEDTAESLGHEWVDDLVSYRREMTVDTSMLDALVLVQNESESGFYVYGPYQSYGTEVVYDVLDFNITDSVSELIEQGPVVEHEMADFSAVDTDYAVISVRDLSKSSELKSGFAEVLNIDKSRVILVNFDNYIANDLQSIEKQTEEIIEQIEEAEH